MGVRDETTEHSDDGVRGWKRKEVEPNRGGGHPKGGQVQLEEAQGEAKGGESCSEGGEKGCEEEWGRDERLNWRSFWSEVAFSNLGQWADQRQGEHSCWEDGGSTDAEGEEKSIVGEQKGAEDGAEAEAESKRGVCECVDSCRACGVACQEECQDGGPEDTHAEALH